jgi:hypothetical protein
MTKEVFELRDSGESNEFEIKLPLAPLTIAALNKSKPPE